MTDEYLVNTFMENAAKASATSLRVRTCEELETALAEALIGAATVFCPCATDMERRIALKLGSQTSDYRTASACVQEVFGAIAETGSLVCSSDGGRLVQAGLLPAHHVALVSASRISHNLDDFFTGLGDTPPTNLTLETGPSRTADIELTLTIGVHGPGRLTVIVF